MGQYPTRLYWMGLRGTARANGVTLRLDQRPKLPDGTPMDGVDYVPGVVAMVMPRAQRWRDMTAGEIEWARTLLGLDDTVCGVVQASGAVVVPLPVAA